ncbi:MAG: TonB family protein [Erythrobacter sp.]|jgi:protein TonB|nr:TonB family protein [Erythrobacter sp.]
MRDLLPSVTLTGRFGSALMALAVSSAMFGLLATLGWHKTSGPEGPAMTLLSAHQFAAEESTAPAEQQLREQPASTAPPAPADPPDEPVREPMREAAAPAPGPVSAKPIVLLISGPTRPSEVGGAEGKAGRGRQPDPGAAAASAASPGNAAPAGAASGGDGDAYGRKVFARIKARQSYVHELARDGIEGSVTLAFAVDGRGRLRDERVEVSSGNRRLDRIALGQLDEAAPFPPPPNREARAFTIRLTYRSRAANR